MSEIGVQWYKHTSSVCALFVLILLWIMAFLDLGYFIYKLLTNGDDTSSSGATDSRIKLVFVLKIIWSLIYIWSIIRCCIGIKKKKPRLMLPYLLTQAFLLIMIVIRLILIIWSKKFHVMNDTKFLNTFLKNMYWEMSCMMLDACVDRTALSSLLQIAVSCSFVVVVYFCYEVLRYEAIRRRHEEIVGHIRPIDAPRIKATPNVYV